MLDRIVERRNLRFEEAYELFESLLREDEVRVSAILSALQTKGYTAEELAGFSKAMRDRAVKVNLGEVVDTAGTGGDNSRTINVSTASALLLSNFVRVAKHGNVAVTSRSGSANVLESLGVRYALSPEEAKAMIEKTNFTFLFAPLYHRALSKLSPVRRKLGVRTIFNVVGPLSNPANPTAQLVGVFSEDLVEVVAEALCLLEVERAVVVHGNGLDEANPRGESVVAEVDNGVDVYKIAPEDFGLKRVRIVPCGSSEESAERIRAVFYGRGLEEDRIFILLNTALAFYSAGFDDFLECRDLAKESLARMPLKLGEIVCSSKNLRE